MAKPRGTLGLLLVVAGAGAGTMTVELAAVRVLAPWFGTSSTVWTNVIGVVLLALAIGYLLGSRWAARPNAGSLLGWALLIAGLTVAWLPSIANPVASFFVPQGVTLDRAANLLVWGSLATSFVLFSPAAVALGCVGPLAVECVQHKQGGHAGVAGGTVLFASTLGSLAGTFGTTHFLVPTLGITVCFYLSGLSLGLLGLLTLRMERGRAVPGLLTMGILLGSWAAPGYRSPELSTGTVMLEQEQSPYQVVRVVERRAGETVTRQLQVNEGFDSFQSVWQPNVGLLPTGHYYNYFCLPAWWSRASDEWDLLVLGLGAGTTWRVLEGCLPESVSLRTEGVEIDKTVIKLARKWMNLDGNPKDRIIWRGWDARAALRQSARQFDQIVLDAYANQMEIPAHLCSLEFFSALRDHLIPGGWLSINVGGFNFEDPVVQAVASTAAKAFERDALVVRVPFSRNCIVYLRRDADVLFPAGAGWDLGSEAPEMILGLLHPIELEPAWTLISPADEEALTDDRNPMELLQRDSIRLAGSELHALQGGR